MPDPTPAAADPADDASLLSAMWTAATRPSWAALTGTLLVAAGLLGLCVGLVTPARLAQIDPGYIMEDGRDDYARVTVRAIALAAEDPKPLSVVVLGASGMREAISSESDLSAMLGESLGEPVRAMNLSAVGARVWETASIVDLISTGYRGVIVIPIAPPVLADTDQELADAVADPRLGFVTPTFDAEAKLGGVRPPARSGVYFLDNYRFYLARLTAIGSNVIDGPAKPIVHRVAEEEPDTPEELERKIDRLHDQVQPYIATHESRLGTIRRVIDLARRQAASVQIVLLEGPRNPKHIDRAMDPQLAAAHRRRIERFADDHRGRNLDLNDAAELTPEEFLDVVHLKSPEARLRFTRALADRITPLLRKAAGKEAGS